MECQKSGCTRESDKCCHHCGQPFCVAHTLFCARCQFHVCKVCHNLFHLYLAPTKSTFTSACATWPISSKEVRTAFLDTLATQPNVLRDFVVYLRRKRFVGAPKKLYFAITAQQRGDFHKFKWSIASDEHLVALLPLNEEYSAEWINEQLGRARAMEVLAPDQWDFVHSSLFASKRKRGSTKEGVTTLSGFSSKSFKEKKLGLAQLKPGEETEELFTAWSEEPDEEDTIHDINSLVPLYNSKLTMETRAQALESAKLFGTTSDEVHPTDQLVAQLAEKLADKDVLVLWGSRTGGHMSFLKKDDVPAREFRHKTGKALFRLVSAEVGDAKVRILAGDPLSGIEADFDLTSMWDAGKMAERFGISHAFSRIEQEYVFFHLAERARNTLHLGMQSGNIETLINNPKTNVLCINENTRGGAGLVNVDKISGPRATRVWREGVPPSNLYLSYNLTTLPSAVGELSRLLLEKYGESVTMSRGVEQLVEELWGVKPSGQSLSELLKTLGKTVSEDTSSPSPKPNMLAGPDEHLAEAIVAYLARKVTRVTEGGEKGKSGPSPLLVDGLRLEVQLLVELARSPSPRVQFALRSLNNVAVAPMRSSEEIWLSIIVQIILNHPLHQQHKKESGSTKGALPKGLAEKARVLVENFEELAKGDTKAEEEAKDLRHALENANTNEKKRLTISNRAQSELRDAESAESSRVKAIQREWDALRQRFTFTPEETEALERAGKLLGLTG